MLPFCINFGVRAKGNLSQFPYLYHLRLLPILFFISLKKENWKKKKTERREKRKRIKKEYSREKEREKRNLFLHLLPRCITRKAKLPVIASTTWALTTFPPFFPSPTTKPSTQVPILVNVTVISTHLTNCKNEDEVIVGFQCLGPAWEGF